MDALPLNVLDLIVLVVLLLSAVLAFFRGFVHETLGIAAWVGAGLAALYGLPVVQAEVRQLIPVTWAADAAAAVAIFLVTLLVLSILTRGIARKVQDSSLGSVDRSLGVLFGLARGAFLVGLAYILLAWMIPPVDHPDWIREARGLPLIQRTAGMIQEAVPEELGIGQAADTSRKTAEDAIELKRNLDTLIQPRVQGQEAEPARQTEPAAPVRQPAPAPAPQPRQETRVQSQPAPDPAPARAPEPAPTPRSKPAPTPASEPPAVPADDEGVGYGQDERQSLDRLFETAQ
ncbi:Colicin V [Caenispirillum salinarum AK4]|uniref:Colicin V n=1 Tax=Caenispirillum salinarum AK4 TaxID=1238182 RepID=K9HQ21_9PROT|nr:CvpA family protein [Caenispirillum salinarum]EKV32393.1 Colicin V [Caenispirillum salinarum AK4]